MTDIIDFKSFFRKTDDDEELFSSKSGKCETNARFYHVMQKTGLGDNLFTGDSAKYRNNRFRDACRKNNVLILFSVVMGNHTHDLLMVESHDRLSEVYRITNTVTSRYIRTVNPKRFKVPGVKVFGERPAMKAVKTLDYLFYLPFYFRENAREYEKLGKTAPYSCFDMYRQGYCMSPYNKTVFEKIFNIEFDKYLGALELTKQEFLNYEKMALSMMPSGSESRILKIDSSKPW